MPATMCAVAVGRLRHPFGSEDIPFPAPAPPAPLLQARDDQGCRRLSGGDEFQVQPRKKICAVCTRGGKESPDPAGASREDASPPPRYTSLALPRWQQRCLTLAMAPMPSHIAPRWPGSTSWPSRLAVARSTLLVRKGPSCSKTTRRLRPKLRICHWAQLPRLTLPCAPNHADSPYPLRVLPGRPCARKCEVAGEGRRSAVAGCPAACEVLVRDGFGNGWHGDASALAALLPLEATLVSPDGGGRAVALEHTRDGRVLCCYTPAAPGYHRLHIATSGKDSVPLPGTPFSVFVSAAEEAAAQHGAGGSQPGCMAAASDGAAAGAGGFQHRGSSAAAPPGPSAAADAANMRGPASAGSRGVPDLMQVWERIAEAAYAADGSADGWDSSDESNGARGSGKENSEEAYIKESGVGLPVLCIMSLCGS